MKRLLSVKTSRSLLVPGWIAAFGLVVLDAPPLGAAASLWLFIAGVVAVPALLMIPRAAGRRLAVAKRSRVTNGRVRFPSWRAALHG
jgi:hypothetical protein